MATTDWAEYIDRKVSHMSEDRRILYFCSENRNVIRDAVNQSVILRERLKVDTNMEVDAFQKICRQTYECFDYTQLFFVSGIRGGIKFKRGRKKGERESSPYPLIPKVLILSDFQAFSSRDQGTSREQSLMIKTFLDNDTLAERETMLLISSPLLQIPDGFAGEIELIQDVPMTEDDISLEMLRRLREENELFGTDVLPDDCVHRIAEEFVGLTSQQVRDVLSAMEGELTFALKDSKYVDLIAREREKEAGKDHAVRFIEVPENETVAGLGCYSDWLNARVEDYRDPVHARNEGTPAPKGVLLCGVPGTGKTAMARETARILSVPLIQFDISRIQSSRLGESEARLSRYLDRVSSFGSCVMLMDEIEKTFKINDSTHEVKIAMLGQLLDWMQTRRSNVFTFITANDISKLPPELLRDGRISERFFAFMPSRDDLASILAVKLQILNRQNGMLFDENLKLEIAKELRIARGLEARKEERRTLASIFDDIATNAEVASRDGIYRLPFMTGANLEKLMEITLRELRNESGGRASTRKKPYGASDLREVMCECAASEDFVPQAQSNLSDLVDVWLRAQRNHYINVSSHNILPFDRFADGRFGKLIRPSNRYDEYYQEVFKREIETRANRNSNREKALDRLAERQNA